MVNMKAMSTGSMTMSRRARAGYSHLEILERKLGVSFLLDMIQSELFDEIKLECINAQDYNRH